MIRYWLNLHTLRPRYNDLEFGHAKTDAENWIGEPLGWFDSPERMNEYVMAEVMPVLVRAWKANPHLRLGQLIANACGPQPDPFYVADGELRDELEKLCEQ